MQIEVMSQHKAEEYATTSHIEKSVVISITSHGTFEAFIIPNRINGIIDILHLKFNDTDKKDEISGGITEADGKKIKEFIYRYKDNQYIDKIIVHCEAGQSRSAGVAAAILKYLTGSDMQIFKDDRYRPNMLCYRTVLNELMQCKL